MQSIGKTAFSHNPNIKSVAIHEKVKKITVWGFFDCQNLQAIHVSEHNPNYADIDGVLYNKDKTELLLFPAGKTRYTIPDGVKRIGDYAFSGCEKLTEVIIPQSVTSVGKEAFYKCRSLVSVSLPDTVTEMGERVFGMCTALKSIAFPAKMKTIAFETCCYCSSLEKIVIPEGVVEISADAFKECGSLKVVSIPKSVEKIGKFAFSNCSALTEVHLHEGLITIGFGAFMECDCLQSMNIPKSVKTIEDKALPKKFMPKTAKNAKKKPSNFAITDGYLEKYHEPDSDILDEKCEGYPFEEYLADCNGHNFPSWSKVKIPNDVTIIGNGCFEECISITSVTIPEGVKKIEDGAFYDCLYLDKVVIPESIEEIGSKIFELCFNLREISFVKNGKKVKIHFNYNDYSRDMSSLNDDSAEQMDLLTQFITARTEDQCNAIISKITSDRVKDELEKIVKKIYNNAK